MLYQWDLRSCSGSGSDSDDGCGVCCGGGGSDGYGGEYILL